MLSCFGLQALKWNHGIIIIHQDALGGTLQVVKLTVFDGPQHTHRSKADEYQRQGKQKQQSGCHAAALTLDFLGSSKFSALLICC